jgi:hypothetical protein
MADQKRQDELEQHHAPSKSMDERAKVLEQMKQEREQKASQAKQERPK